MIKEAEVKHFFVRNSRGSVKRNRAADHRGEEGYPCEIRKTHGPYFTENPSRGNRIACLSNVSHDSHLAVKLTYQALASTYLRKRKKPDVPLRGRVRVFVPLFSTGAVLISTHPAVEGVEFLSTL